MQTCAKEGTCLADLVELASRTCQQAERDHPRRGRGRKPVYEDWLIAVLIVVAVARMKKSKSAQFQFIKEHQQSLSQLLGKPLPSRTTYYDRYARVWRLYQTAIQLQGHEAVRTGLADATVVAVDKSLVAARGPVGHVGRRPRRGTDRHATWGRSEHDGWVFGFGYEVVVSCGKNGLICPLLASAATASQHESVSFREQIPCLPRCTKYVLADRAFDNDDSCEAIEWRHGKRTGRRFVCHPRRSARRQARQAWRRTARRRLRHQHRLQRKAFLQTARGKQLYRRRGTSVEPFNSWLKTMFQLEDRVWHRGLNNNRTQLLASIFIHQLLLKINRRRGNKNGRTKWLLDAL